MSHLLRPIVASLLFAMAASAALVSGVAFAQAGQTVKIRFRSTNDFSLETSFFFDSLALDATICQ